jgi:hypothetical protein
LLRTCVAVRNTWRVLTMLLLEECLNIVIKCMIRSGELSANEETSVIVFKCTFADAERENEPAEQEDVTSSSFRLPGTNVMTISSLVLRIFVRTWTIGRSSRGTRMLPARRLRRTNWFNDFNGGLRVLYSLGNAKSLTPPSLFIQIECFCSVFMFLYFCTDSVRCHSSRSPRQKSYKVNLRPWPRLARWW